MDKEKEKEGDVVVAVGTHLVVEEQGEKEDNGADEGGEESLLKLFETRFAQNVFVGALESVESYPAQGDDDEAAP